jgi:hypothetical protein
VWLLLEPTFRRTHSLHLQCIKTLGSSQLAARICLTADGEYSLLHVTRTIELIRYLRVDDWPLLRNYRVLSNELLLGRIKFAFGRSCDRYNRWFSKGFLVQEQNPEVQVFSVSFACERLRRRCLLAPHECLPRFVNNYSGCFLS